MWNKWKSVREQLRFRCATNCLQKCSPENCQNHKLCTQQINKKKGVDSIAHENIAESEKSIADEVIELFFPRIAFWQISTPHWLWQSSEVCCFMSRWTCLLHSQFYYCFVLVWEWKKFPAQAWTTKKAFSSWIQNLVLRALWDDIYCNLTSFVNWMDRETWGD